MEQNEIVNKEEIVIPVDKVQKEFDEHLSIPENDKILFSGKYGIGKSYFLDCYFKSDVAQKKYNTITLSPVNYVVSANEDIFELIKVDIIRQLFLTQKLNLVIDNPFLSSIVVKEFVKSKSKAFAKKPIRTIVDFAAKLTKLGAFGEIEGQEISNSVVGLLEDYSKFEDALNSKYKPEENVLNEYVEEKFQAIGTYIENNLISQSISNSLFKIKETESKENVLIIEDFDRIDPAHIFRVLNILSAHHNEGVGNKFGFDKVIIVCDLNNIKGLYEHLYGAKVDFDGYIDKFYSIAPFYFDNKRALNYFLQNQLGLKFKKETIEAIAELLFVFIKNGDISLRKIIKTNSFSWRKDFEILNFNYRAAILNRDYERMSVTYAAPNHIMKTIDELKIFISDIELYEVILYLITLFGGESFFKQKLDEYLTGERAGMKLLNSNWSILLGFSKHFLDNIQKPVPLFFSSIERMGPSRFSFQGLAYEIVPRWNSEMQYDGITSYFNGSKFRLISNSNVPKAIEITELVNTVKRILGFINENHI